MTRQRAIAVLRLAITLLSLALVFRILGAEDILARLGRIAPQWGLAAVAALSAQIVLSALRWHLTAAALGLALNRSRAVTEYYLSVLGNSLLPGGVLGDVARIARLRHEAGLRRAMETVVVERMAGQLGLAIAAAAGLWLWFGPPPATPGIAAGLVLGLSVTALAARRLPRDGALAKLARLFRTAWFAGGIWRRQLTLSLAIVTCNLVGYWAAAQAVGLTLGPAEALFVLPITLTAMLLPVTINGWGLREGVAAALWPLVGASPAQAVAASVVFGAAALLAALPGLAGLLQRGAGPA